MRKGAKKMSDTEYDLVVIGAGPAGTPAAMAAAQFGKKVLLIDKREGPGGECLFEGCIPSKVLENAANSYASIVNSKKFHIDTSHPQIHWEEVLRDKDEIVKKRSMGALMQMEKLPTLRFEQGRASFVDAHTIELNGKTVTFEKALIATGAKTSLPPLHGSAITKAWINRDVFFEETLPKEILFIGAGAISCELAQMFNKLGVKTHILERSERILKRLSSEAALLVQNKMIQNGIEISCNVTLESLEIENDKFSVHYVQDAQRKHLLYEKVLIATGRVANVDGLNLEKAGVAFDKYGVSVNEQLQSSQAHIYACGDVINAPKFAHTASYEAGIVIHNMFAPKLHSVNYSKNSWVLFSDPQVAVVGLDEEAAKQKGLQYSVAKYEFMQDARAQLDKQVEGYLKYIIDTTTQVIVGIEIVNEDAASLIGEASLIVANGMSIMDIMNTIHPHPTLTESFGVLAKQLFFKSMMQRKRG
jgi:dihydrolipoamide dehydrogenase